MKRIFQNNFLNVLEEQEGITDQETLGTDPGTPQGTFDDVEPSPIAQLQKQQAAGSIQSIQSWIAEIEGFINYLNGLDAGSLNSQINRADCDSIMADIQRSESKKISRLAQDLSALSESLKQYLLVALNKQSSAGSI